MTVSFPLPPGITEADVNAPTSKLADFGGYTFDHEALGKYGCANCEGSGLER